MKIGIDGRALQFRSWGGVRHYTLELLQALFRLDHENEYHVFYNAWKKIAVPRFSEFPNVTVHYSRWPNKFFNLAIKLFGRPAFHIPNGSLDILFVPNLNFVACPASTKLIAVVHDLSFEHFPEYFPWRFRIWHQTLNPRSLFRRAGHVIAVSDHTENDLVETYGIAAEKISVIYPGITSMYHFERSEASRAYARTSVRDSSAASQNDGGGEYILYFGALEPRKNIEGLINAFEQLNAPSPRGIGQGEGTPQFPLLTEEGLGVVGLVIAGLSTSYVKRLKRRIAQSRCREQIVLKENPTEEEKHALYTGATLFVYPSFYEGFGFPPLEAMAAGVPVVASSASSVPEVCGNAALLVSPWKVDEIAAGMRVLLEDDEVRRHYVEAGRMRVREFSWERCAKQMLGIFRQSSTI